MKAWLWDGSQGISHLGLAETPNPVAKDGEAVMEVHYAALNPADRYLAEKVIPISGVSSHASCVGAGRDASLRPPIKFPSRPTRTRVSICTAHLSE